MDLSHITKVAETDSPETVNRMLEEGWILLSSAGGKREDSEIAQIIYALGYVKRPEFQKQV